MSFFYHGIWRMDWGLGNPNKTAALIAILMVASWSFAYIRKCGFYLAIIAFISLGIALMHTFSRGGIIAAFCGNLFAVLAFVRPWKKSHIIGTIISIWIIISVSLYLDAEGRFSDGIVQEDRSISNRWEIWKCAPKMMVDSPNGWGTGNSGNAYMQWYQDPNSSEKYRTLVNSHLTYLVEQGWIWGFLYIGAWGSILLLCLPSKGLRSLAIPFGIWLSLGIASIFSSIEESIVVWVVPAISLILALVLRYQSAIWPQRILWLSPFLASGLVLIAIFVVGKCETGISVEAGGEAIVIGKGKSTNWVVINKDVLGPDYGHILRRFLKSNGNQSTSIGVASSLAGLPPNISGRIIIAGDQPNNFQMALKTSGAQKVILLNPTVFPEGLQIPTEKISVIFGEFSQSPSVEAWEEKGVVTKVLSTGNYIRDWPKYINASE